MSSQTTGTSAKDDLFTMIRESLPGSTEVQTRQWRERLQKLCVEPDGSRSTLFQTLEKVVTAAASRLDPALGGRRIDYQVTALIGSAYARDKSGFSWDSRSLDRSSIWILSLANQLSRINDQPDSAYSRITSNMWLYWGSEPEIAWKLQLQASTALLLASVVHRGPRLLKSITLRRHAGAMSDILDLALCDDPTASLSVSGPPVQLKSNLELAEGSIRLSKTQEDVMSYLQLWLGTEGLHGTSDEHKKREKSVAWNTLRMQLAEGLPDRFRDRSSTTRKDGQSSKGKERDGDRGGEAGVTDVADWSRPLPNPQTTVPTVPTASTAFTVSAVSTGSSYINPLLLGKYPEEQDAENDDEKAKDDSYYEKDGSFAGQFFQVYMAEAQSGSGRRRGR